MYFLIIYNFIVLCLTHNSSEGEVRAHLELCTSPLRVVHSDTNIYSHTHTYIECTFTVVSNLHGFGHVKLKYIGENLCKH